MSVPNSRRGSKSRSPSYVDGLEEDVIPEETQGAEENELPRSRNSCASEGLPTCRHQPQNLTGSRRASSARSSRRQVNMEECAEEENMDVGYDVPSSPRVPPSPKAPSEYSSRRFSPSTVLKSQNASAAQYGSTRTFRSQNSSKAQLNESTRNLQSQNPSMGQYNESMRNLQSQNPSMGQYNESTRNLQSQNPLMGQYNESARTFRSQTPSKVQYNESGRTIKSQNPSMMQDDLDDLEDLKAEYNMPPDYINSAQSMRKNCSSRCKGFTDEMPTAASRGGGGGCCRRRTCQSEERKPSCMSSMRPCGEGKSKFQGDPGPSFGPPIRPTGHEMHMKSPHAGHEMHMKSPHAGHEMHMKSPQSPPVDMDSHHHHHHHHHHPESLQGLIEPDPKKTSALNQLSQLKRSPSYSLCGINQDLDFLDGCCRVEPKKLNDTISSLPGKTCLRQEDIEQLIRCETKDVESAQFLTGDERKSYKKPCPKQQKAQMTVKALMQAHTGQTCQKEYSPLEQPDPDDISPELAAAMMFSQEKGIKLVESPNNTISNLFPDEEKIPFPEKSSISVVDRGSEDQKEVSEMVLSEGVSDSAYTRTMKDKGECMGVQRSFDVDFAIGQSKREYVLVAQKPQRVNKVQYRGGSTPSWFPGYLTAFPGDTGLKIVPSPSKIFQKAWIHSNPKNIQTSDVIVLD